MPTIAPSSRLAACSLVAVTLVALAPARAFAADDLTPAPSEGAPAPEAAPTPSATTRRPFGAKGAVILDRLFGYNAGLSGDSLLSVVGASRDCSSSTWPGPEATSMHACRTAAWLRPTVDVGVGSGFTLGGTLSARLDFASEVTGASYTPPDAYSLGVHPRVGYVLPINDDLFLWPRIGAGYTRTFVTGGARDGNGWSAEAELAIGFRAGRYVFFSATPRVAYASATFGEPAQPGAASSFHVGMTGAVGLAFGP